MNRELLEKPFSKEQIKTRKGLNNKTFSYVPGTEYIKRLNEAIEGGDWDFEIVEHRMEPSEVIVLGKLRANGVTKMSFGGTSITVSNSTGERVSIADDLKAASTDALKKCSSLLGIGLHLYEDRSYSTQGNDSSQGTGGNWTPKAMTDRQLAAIRAMGSKLGLHDDDLDRRSIEAFNCVVEKLSRKDASALISEFNEELRQVA